MVVAEDQVEKSMNLKTYIRVSGFVVVLFGCNQSNNQAENKVSLIDSGNIKKDTFNLKTEKTNRCDFSKYLNDPHTSPLARKLFNGEVMNLDNDDPLYLLDSLMAQDIDARPFYFKVITNSYKSSDGYYSEGLGDVGKNFIENNTIEFASYFDNKDCFDDSDLKTWADITILEFGISGENKDGTYDKTIVDVYTQNLTLNCKDCSANQKATIDNFSKILKLKWSEFLKIRTSN